MKYSPLGPRIFAGFVAGTIVVAGWVVPSLGPAAADETPFSAKVNFQSAAAPVPAGYLADGGAVYGDRGNGHTYGWNANNTANARDRNAANSPDQRYDTLVHTQRGGTFIWEMAVPNGAYSVRVVAGDPSYVDSVYKVVVEGALTVNGTPISANRWIEGTRTVTVADGKLTVTNAAGSSNNKLAFLEITSSGPPPPPPTSPKINFQPAAAPVPAGYLADGGAAFGNRGNGHTYGWNADNTTNARDRNAANSPDQRYDTLVHTQRGGTFTWEMAVPDGTYTVRVVAGDPSYVDSVYKVAVEGVLTVNGTPTSANRWVEGTQTVTVADGKLSVTNAAGSSNNKLAFLEITPPGADPVLAAAGDIACDPYGPGFNSGLGTPDVCRQRATSDLLASINPTAVAALGDLQYEDAAASKWPRSYELSWGSLKAKTKPAAGNHEYQTAAATHYFNYFGAAAGDPAKGYYSYGLGTWHVIVLNSNCLEVGGCEVGSPQEQWLRADLAAHPTACTLAYWHHPRWSSGFHGSLADTDAFWRALHELGAEVVLSGHDHTYERFAPMDAAGAADPVDGIRQFVVGTGGRSHTGFFVTQPNSEVRSNGTFGVLALTLHPGSYDWRFVPEAGKTFTDSGSASCH